MGSRNMAEMSQPNRASHDPYQALLNLSNRYSYMGTDDELEERKDEPRREEVRIEAKKSSLVVDPFGTFYNIWLSVVSVAIVYNLYLIVGRTVFWELENLNPLLWFILDYVCDAIYLLDMVVHSFTGFLNNNGLMETDVSKTFKRYAKSFSFAIDIFSIFPTDALYAITGTTCVTMACPVIFRLNRVVRYPRLREFFYITEMHTRFFALTRACELALSVLVLIHWNACLYFAVSYCLGFGSDDWVYPALEGTNSTLKHQYIYCIYWSTKVLITLDSDSPPTTNAEYIYMIFQLLLSVVIFATVLGHVTSLVTNSYSRRHDYQNKMDDLKDFFRQQKVNQCVQRKVLRWCDYMYRTKQPFRQDDIIGRMQEELQAQVIRSMYREIISGLHLFKDSSETFLNEVCLKFRLKVYCPGDYVCHKGDIGKEMFILKNGLLQVEDSEDGCDGIYTRELQDCRCFGDLSLVEGYGKKHGYRRMANVRSVGYTELLCLTKKDLGDVLDEYGEFKGELIQRGKVKLMKLGLSEDQTTPSVDLSGNQAFY